MPATILAAVDRSPAALQAVRLLAGYRGRRDALSIALVNVQPPPFGDWPGFTADLRSLDAALQRAGRAELEEPRRLLAGAGLAVDASVRLGVASEQILAAAAGGEAAAIVIGTRGEGVLRGFALGSVALRVAHAARSPVVLVQPESRLPPGLGVAVRALVALDGSPHATRALPALFALEPWLGRLELDLVHVRPPPSLRERFAPDEQARLDHLAELEAEEATREARAIAYATTHPARVHEPAGDPAAEVVRLAEKLGVDLVVAGTRGLGALHHALIGSVALKIAVGSPVPVMLTP